MPRYRTQATEPEWPDWSEPHTRHPTYFIEASDGGPSLAITQPFYGPKDRIDGSDNWFVLEPTVDIDSITGTANEAECREIAAQYLAAADKLAEITAQDNNYPLEMD